MIRAIQIKNYKGLRSVDLESARRINVILGPNGTGKTALLEAIFLAGAQSPEPVMRYRQWRGRETSVSIPADQIRREFFEDIYGDPGNDTISIALLGDTHDSRTLTITKQLSGPIVSQDGQIRQSNIGVEFSWSSPTNNSSVFPVFSDQGLNLGVSSVSPLGAHFVSARSSLPAKETAQMYSTLSLSGAERGVNEHFLREYNSLITDLLLLAPSGPPALYGRMRGQNQKLLPISEVSGGANQLLGILVRIASSNGGVMLIDEIENGFYYKHYESVWRTIYQMSISTQTQIFVSTHSLECLQALGKALGDKVDEVMVYRSSIENDKIEYEPLEGESLLPAAEITEVR